MEKLVTVIFPDGRKAEDLVQVPESFPNECFDVDFYQTGVDPETTVFIRSFARLEPSWTTPFVQIIVCFPKNIFVYDDYVYDFEVDEEWFIDTTELELN